VATLTQIGSLPKVEIRQEKLTRHKIVFDAGSLIDQPIHRSMKNDPQLQDPGFAIGFLWFLCKIGADKLISCVNK